jgi:phosphoribosylamine-glycine ligase
MKRIAIVGKPYKNFISYLEEFHPEIEVIAFLDKRDSYDFPKSVKAVYPVDFSSRKSVLSHAKKLSDMKIIGLESEYENGVLSKAWLGEALNLPALSEKAALVVTDKLLMRKCFREKTPSITPAFSRASDWKDVENFVNEYGFPVILKPTNLVKSLLVTKNDSFAELRRNFDLARKKVRALYEKYDVHNRQPLLIVEEFLQGPVFSVDLVIDISQEIRALPVVDLVTARDLGVPDNYNYKRLLSSQFSKEEQKALQAVAIEGVRASNLTNSAAHAELVLTSEGPKIIEIGARFGGYRSVMYDLSYGVNMYEAILNLAVGKQVKASPAFRAYTAVYEIFPEKSGSFDKIENLEKVEELSSFYSFSMSRKVKEAVGLSKDGYKFCANIILSNKKKEVFDKDCAFVQKHVPAAIT